MPKKDFHQPWMDEPMVQFGDWEGTQLDFWEGRVYLASRYTKMDKLYQNWHLPIRSRYDGSKFVQNIGKDRHPTRVVLGAGIQEAIDTLKFFVQELEKKRDAEVEKSVEAKVTVPVERDRQIGSDAFESVGADD